MRTFVSFFCLLTTVSISGVPAAHAQHVDELISTLERELQAGSFRIANAATQQLDALGRAAEPSLPVVERVFAAAVETEERILVRNTTRILMRFSSDLPVEESLIQWLRQDLANGVALNSTWEALEACGARCSAALPILVDHIASGQNRGYWAFRVLGAMGSEAQQAIPLLTRELNSSSDDDFGRQLIRGALAKIDPEQADTIITSLISELRSGNRDAFSGAFSALEALGPDLRDYADDLVAIRREQHRERGGPLTLSPAYVELLCTIGGEVAVAEAALALEGRLGIDVVLAFGRLDGTPEALLALPGLVRALGSNVTADRAGMKASVGAPAYSLSVRAAAALAIRRNGLEREAWELLRRDPELMSTAYAGLIWLGVEESVPDLLALLRSTNRPDVASVFLNSGHPSLESAARTWADANGYRVTGTAKSATAAVWGGRRR